MLSRYVHYFYYHSCMCCANANIYYQLLNRLQHNVLQRATLRSIQVQIMESINKWSHRLI